jgi:diaminohydroxyphosphoribosylaminopyrimidine deaminase/5-amino-6-(5-phosphoribosylamino)uracil reductase
MEYLRRSGIDVEIAADARARAIVEPFARAVRARRPFVTLKMAMSLDGYVASQPGRQEWLTGEQAREFVRELRIAHDAVAVGAGTVRVDDPQLTVRPAHHRLREYVRIVACETESVPASSRIFHAREGYAKTIVLAPDGVRAAFEDLDAVADVVYIGNSGEKQLDIAAAMHALYERGIHSMLCEGGPTMAGHLLNLGLADRFVWLVAPRFLRNPAAVPVITAGSLERRGLQFDRVERLGPDLLVWGTFDSDV